MTQADGRSTGEGHYDVVVVGGGPAGCAVGVFTARYGLDTLVLDRGRSSLQRIAHLENYLGFPGGIDTETFLELLHSHAETAGCTLLEEMATTVEETEGGFVVTTEEGNAFDASFVVAASKYDHDYLEGIDDEALFTTQRYEGEEYTVVDKSSVSDGRTPVEGLYVAGRLAHDRAQVQIQAGHGTIVAKALLTDLRREQGYPEELATAYYDWLVVEGGYGGEEWESDLREQFADALPADHSLSDADKDRLREEWVRERLSWRITPAEQARRQQAGHRTLAAHLDEEAVLDAVSDERIIERARELESTEASP